MSTPGVTKKSPTQIATAAINPRDFVLTILALGGVVFGNVAIVRAMDAALDFLTR